MRKLFILFLILAFGLTPVVLSTTYASTPDSISDYQKQLEENKVRQDELNQKIDQLQAEGLSLQVQFDKVDSQMALTTSQIEESRIKIAEREAQLQGLNLDIEKLIERILRIEASVSFQWDVYAQRIRARYINGRVSAVEILFGAESLNEALTKLKYLQIMALQDQRLIRQMTTTQENLDHQKILLEKTKSQVELVKAELVDEKSNLEARRTDLAFQKEAKAALLAQTKGEEDEYQQQLAEIQAEQRAIERALASFISQLIEGGVPAGEKISKGGVIGVQGSTGMSTGDHVHFGVYTRCGEGKDAWCHTNPRSYLDSGDLSWPLSDYKVSQEYGQTPFALSSGYYKNNFHNGLDMYGAYNSPVLAAADGTVSYSIDAHGGKGAIVYHSQELMTLYWHIK